MESHIIFDQENNYKLKVIEPEQYKATLQLKQGCDSFPGEVDEFMKAVRDFLTFMDNQSRLVEDQKLRSIALRSQVQQEIDSRKQKQLELQEEIESRQKELERLSAEIRSFEEYERQVTENNDKLSLI